MMKSNDEKFMRRCLELAKEAKENGKTAVGSVLVQNGKIIGEGVEGSGEIPDLLAHAEVIAVLNVVKNIGSKDLSDCELYTTVEPCFMCGFIIRQTKIRRVIYGTEAGKIGSISSENAFLGSKNIPNWKNVPKIVGGVLKKECEDLLK